MFRFLFRNKYKIGILLLVVCLILCIPAIIIDQKIQGLQAGARKYSAAFYQGDYYVRSPVYYFPEDLEGMLEPFFIISEEIDDTPKLDGQAYSIPSGTQIYRTNENAPSDLASLYLYFDSDSEKWLFMNTATVYTEEVIEKSIREFQWAEKTKARFYWRPAEQEQGNITY